MNVAAQKITKEIVPLFRHVIHHLLVLNARSRLRTRFFISLRTPLIEPSLFQHGEEDVRVPLSQGTTFYRALTLNGVNVEMVIYPREPHGLREPKHIRDAMERNFQWFEHWLSDGGPTSEP